MTLSDYTGVLLNDLSAWQELAPKRLDLWGAFKQLGSKIASVSGGMKMEWDIGLDAGGQINASGTRVARTQKQASKKLTLGFAQLLEGASVPWNVKLAVDGAHMPIAYGNEIDRQVNFAKGYYDLDLQGMMLRDGSGRLAIVTDSTQKAAAHPYLTVGDVYVNRTNYPAATYHSGTRLLRNNLYVDIGGITGAMNADSVHIDDIDVTNQNVYFDAGTNLSNVQDGDFIYLEDNRATMTWDGAANRIDTITPLEMVGLEGFVGDGADRSAYSVEPQGLYNYAGYNTSTFRDHRSLVTRVAAGTEATWDLTWALLLTWEASLDTVGFNEASQSGELFVNDVRAPKMWMVTCAGVANKYATLALTGTTSAPIFRTVDPTQLNYGFGYTSSIVYYSSQYGIVPLKVYRQAPPGKIFALRPDQIDVGYYGDALVQFVPGKIAGIWDRPINYTGANTMEATLEGYPGMRAKVRARHAVLCNLTML